MGQADPGLGIDMGQFRPWSEFGVSQPHLSSNLMVTLFLKCKRRENEFLNGFVQFHIGLISIEAIEINNGDLEVFQCDLL